MNTRRFLQLDFLPRSADAGLLALRLWFGLSLLLLHGWAKLTGFSDMAATFPNPMGLGSSTSLALAIFAEVGCALLIIAGLLTRAAAFVEIILMSVAFFMVHQASLAPGPGSGELAFLYLGGFLTLLLAGAGRFSLDARLGTGKTR